jgi:hypothetical protein
MTMAGCGHISQCYAGGMKPSRKSASSHSPAPTAIRLAPLTAPIAAVLNCRTRSRSVDSVLPELPSLQQKGKSMAEYDDINRRLLEGRKRKQARTSLRHDTAELASTYDQVSLHHLFEHGKQLISALNISSGEAVLDIGAGTGRLAAYVAEIVGPAGYVVAMDPLPPRVEIAQSKASDNLEACVGRAEVLSEFPDETFDVVYLNSVFHWVEDKSQQ